MLAKRNLKNVSQYEIRTAQRHELDFAIALAAAEGWNPGLHDADCFYNTDPNGFLIGYLDGQPISCISAVSYGGTFGFIGFYIVKPEYRGQGYGIQIWKAAIDRLAGHNIGLDGVVEQQPNYIKSGFKLAYRNIRYEGVAQPSSDACPQVIPLTTVPIGELCRYDRAFFPTDRPTFLKGWIQLPESTGFAWVEDHQLRGYGVVRQCRQGYKIGPLFADTPAIADAIFLHLSSSIEAGSPIFLDIPEVNAAAVDLVQRYNMHKVFETARMYTQVEPSLAIDRLFGVTTFELG